MTDESVLTCLTDDGAHLVVVTAEPRLRCFETATGAPYGDALRLPSDHVPRCLATRGRLLAIGSTSGSVVVVDLSHGAVVHETNAHGDRIHDLCFNSDATRLYVCSNDGQCSEWELAPDAFVKRRQFRPSKRAVTKTLAISHDDAQLACGSSTIRLVDTASLKTMAKLRGHASDVVAMRFGAGGDTLFSIARGDRTINAFRIKTKASKKDVLDASTCFMGPDSPRTLSVGTTAIACVLQTGNVAVFNIAPAKKSSTPKSVTKFATLSCAGAALAVHVTGDDSVLVAGGHIAQPVFKSAAIGASVDLAPFDDDNAPERASRKRRGKVDAPAEVVSVAVKKQKTADALGAVPTEETLPLPLDDTTAPATADSMITLLSQGLKSNDNQKLSLVLDQTRDSFVASTLARLPPALIPSLVTVLVKRIRSSTKPNHLANAINWLTCLLQRHTAYLLGNAAVADQLSEAKLLLEDRQRCASALMALSGRLTMLHCHLQRNETAQETVSQQTVFVHNVNEQ